MDESVWTCCDNAMPVLSRLPSDIGTIFNITQHNETEYIIFSYTTHHEGRTLYVSRYNILDSTIATLLTAPFNFILYEKVRPDWVVLSPDHKYIAIRIYSAVLLVYELGKETSYGIVCESDPEYIKFFQGDCIVYNSHNRIRVYNFKTRTITHRFETMWGVTGLITHDTRIVVAIVTMKLVVYDLSQANIEHTIIDMPSLAYYLKHVESSNTLFAVDIDARDICIYDTTNYSIKSHFTLSRGGLIKDVCFIPHGIAVVKLVSTLCNSDEIQYRVDIHIIRSIPVYMLSLARDTQTACVTFRYEMPQRLDFERDKISLLTDKYVFLYACNDISVYSLDSIVSNAFIKPRSTILFVLIFANKLSVERPDLPYIPPEIWRIIIMFCE